MKKIFTFLACSFAILLLACSLNPTKLYGQNCLNCPQLLYVQDTVCKNFTALEQTDGFSNVTPTTNHPTKVCRNTKMKYTIEEFSGCNYGLVYSNFVVTGGTLISAAGNSFCIQWGNGSVGKVIFQFASTAPNYTCDTIATVFFDLIASPIAAFTPSPQPACFNSPTTINVNSNATVNATNYFWTFGDGYTALGSNPSHNYTAPGTYQVCLYVSNQQYDTLLGAPTTGPPCFTCKDSVCHTVVINPLPAPPIQCVATVCANTNATYTTTAAGCALYNWVVVGGTIISGLGTNTIIVAWGNGIPQGSVSLSVSGCTSAYCAQPNTVVVPIVPSSYPIVGDTLVCMGTNHVYSLPTWPATTYNWTVTSPAAVTPINTNASSVNVGFPGFGNHTLTATYFDTTLGCGGTATKQIYARPILRIDGANSVCQNTTSILQSYFLNPFNVPIPTPCNWTISPAVGASITSGNGTSTPTFSWTTAGTYTITATPTVLNPPVMCGPAEYVVTVKPSPIISSINGDTSICAGNTAVYSATANLVGQFTWTVTGGTSIGLNGNQDSVQITWNNSGPYSIQVSMLSIPDNCPSNTLTKTYTPYPTPTLTGSTQVCVDDTLTYNLTGTGAGIVNWFVTPSNRGTVISGQGTPTAQIKWHGDTSATNPLTAYLHYGVCGKDSVLITINKPPVITISSSGSLCSTGVTLSTNAASGVYTWSAVGQPLLPAQPTNLSTISGLYNPGTYAVTIANVNNTGCKVSKTFNIPDVGRPDAQIYTTGITDYCLPNLPNLTLDAITGAGYNYQWVMNGSNVGTNSPTLTVNSILINSAGTYNFYCIVTVGLCKDTSGIIKVVVSNCPVPPGCIGEFVIGSISNCSPFTLTLTATAPGGATLSSETTFHKDDNTTISGLTTKNYTTAGLKQIKVCAFVTGPGANCFYCIDTFVTVNLAALFITNDNCGIMTLTDQSTVIPPVTISSYAWTVGDATNLPVPLPQASFNNASIANPTLTITQSGIYIITQSVTGSNGCVSEFKDTITVSLANAGFTVTDTCALSPIAISNVQAASTHYWNFGDAATSFSYPTSHAYTSAGTYIILHAVTNAFGCKDTATKGITIFANPTCTISYTGPTTFCSTDSLVMTACAGYTNYKWFKNGVQIPLATAVSYAAKQTGQYSFTALTVNGCVVSSDTVTITVIPPVSTTFSQTGSLCVGNSFALSVPTCTGCGFNWAVDGSGVPVFSNTLSATAGTAPFTVGPHWVQVYIFESGCLSTDSILITINPNPTVSISTVGPVPMCSNNLYTFTASTSTTSPLWSWSLNNQIIGTTSTLSASSAGTYQVIVTDAITQCTASATEQIMESPNLSLFPIGCDLICDTAKLFLPLPSLNGNLANYTSINWYNNAPPYAPVIATGVFFPLNVLPIGNHNLSVIVTASNGCMDTSTVYNITTYQCVFPLAFNEVVLQAFKRTDYNHLLWTTKNETGIWGYEIEKSTDGIHYEKMEGIRSPHPNSEGSQSYAYKDMHPVLGENYYRLQVKTIDNEKQYSNVVMLRWNEFVAHAIKLYPNPTTGIFIVEVEDNAANDIIATFGLYDVQGILVDYKTNFTKAELDLTQLVKGIYIYKGVINGNSFQGKVIKE